jgi:hypothetical protein
MMGVQVDVQLRNLVHRRSQQRHVLRNDGSPCCARASVLPPANSVTIHRASAPSFASASPAASTSAPSAAFPGVRALCPTSPAACCAHACNFAVKEILLLPCCCFDILKVRPTSLVPARSCCGIILFAGGESARGGARPAHDRPGGSGLTLLVERRERIFAAGPTEAAASSCCCRRRRPTDCRTLRCIE